MRICRMYMSDLNPSLELNRLVNYVIYVFLPVKKYGLFQHGPYHLLDEIKLLQIHCTVEEKAVLHPIINWNGFFSHEENIQVALLCYLEVRQRGNVIWERRKGEPVR